MATIDFLNGSKKTIDADTAYQIWQVLNGDIQGTPEQQGYCSQIKRMYLNWRKAPDSYLLRHADIVSDMVISEWVVNRQGIPTRPEPSHVDNWRVSRLLGLV